MTGTGTETQVCRCGKTITRYGGHWTDEEGWDLCPGDGFHEPADDPNYLPAVIRYLTEETS